MTAARIAVLDYGIGNLRSAEKGLQHVGADARLVTDPDEADRADAVVVPGVGSFGRCREALRDSGLDRAALAAAREGRPVLGVCIGMQLLYEGSEESPGVAGLGLLEGMVRLLPPGVRRPQMQWNRLRWDPTHAGHPLIAPLGPEPWVYFLHSYAAPTGPEMRAWCEYPGPVPAIVGRDRIWATQFHPEKSGRSGLALLAGFATYVAASLGAPGAP